jgi:hypothetical protein
MNNYYKAVEKRLNIRAKHSQVLNGSQSSQHSQGSLLTPVELDNLDVVAFHKATGNDTLFCKIISDMLTQNFLVHNVVKDYMINNCNSLDSFKYIFSIMSPENCQTILSKLSKKSNLFPVHFPKSLSLKEHEALETWYAETLSTMTVKEIRAANIPLDNVKLNIIADNLGAWDE